MKDPDESLCLDRDINVVEKVDVEGMNGFDESLCLDRDVKADG